MRIDIDVTALLLILTLLGCGSGATTTAHDDDAFGVDAAVGRDTREAADVTGLPDVAPDATTPVDVAGLPDAAPDATTPVDVTGLPDVAPDAAPDAVRDTEADAATPDVRDTTAAPADASADGVDAAAAAPTHRLLVSELLASNQGSLEDEAGRTPDWIELYNPGPAPVDLAGWQLSDDAAQPGRATLAAGVVPPGGFVVVFASGQDGGAEGERHVPFALSAAGEEVILSEPDGAVADHVVFGPQEPDVSWGRPQGVVSRTLVEAGAVARASDVASGDWTAPGYDDAGWAPVALPVGFDRVDDDGGEELALFAPTSQSTNGFGFTGRQAVDGDPRTFSHTATGDRAPWWRVDLGGLASIAGVTLLNRLDCCPERLYNVTVEVEDADGRSVWRSETLNPVFAGETPTSPGDSLVVPFEEPMLGRYVRVRKAAVGENEWLTLAEVQVEGGRIAPYEPWLATDDAALFAAGTAYFRLPVTTGGAVGDRLVLDLLADDAARVWVDGRLAHEQNHGPDATAVEVEAAQRVALDPALLDPAVSLLAVAVEDRDGEDALLGVALTAQDVTTVVEARRQFAPPTPGEPNGAGWDGRVATPLVVPPRGFHDAPFEVTVTVDTPDAVLVYTLDGSLPDLTNGVVVSGDETGAVARFTVATTQTLRARAYADGMGDSEGVTHTWLFLDDVVRQPAAPEGLPSVWDGLGQPPIAADYEMDPDVALDPTYAADLRDGLRAIPTLSLVLDPEDLWGAGAGIYVHSTQRGRDWERMASVELIHGDGSTGFQERCGVRIHGYGWRPHENTKKHSLRLEFRDDYGPRKLHYPLFPDAPVERFDSIVLRAQGSRSWQDFRDPTQAQYIRDAFARDTAFAMDKADGHAAYVHLYLNGLYWGLYMAVERPDADFGAERFGGDDDEYDAINRRIFTNEAVDGDLVAYEALLALADEDLSDDAAAAAVAGMLDLDDLVDYMLIHQYTSNRDGPELFQHNNMRGVRQRSDGARFRWFVWDMEYSLWNAGDHINIDVDVPGAISHVYARLRANAGFRARYAARARMHLTGDGALTPGACLARWEARAVQIENAIVAESARWGDTDRPLPYTRDDEWAAERRRLTEEYFPVRTGVLVEQLRAAGLYVD